VLQLEEQREEEDAPITLIQAKPYVSYGFGKKTKQPKKIVDVDKRGDSLMTLV